MSVDLDWTSLDADLTASVVQFLTTTFATAARPSFLGPVTVTSFSFGDCEPQIELVEIRDVDREFLEEEPGDDGTSMSMMPPENRQSTNIRPDLRRGSSSGIDDEPDGGDDWLEGRSPSEYGVHGHHDWDSASVSASFTAHVRRRPPPPSSALFSPGLGPRSLAGSQGGLHPFASAHMSVRDHSPAYASTLPPPSESPPAPDSSTFSPSLQLHLRVTYSGNLTLGLATSLLINYPSPLFMALPLALTLTSLAFDGVFVVAFEGDRRRVHFSVVDPSPPVGHHAQSKGAAGAGVRLLKGANVESEVGQADKHVLKNVGKVEKFVLDVVRGALESELVFP